MRAFLSVQFRAAVCCLLFVPSGIALSNSCYADQHTGADAWATHHDPAGFVVDVPPAWTVAKDPATGRIVLRGARGEQAVIWPLFLQQVALDAGRAAILLPQLARTVDAQMPWGRAQSMSGAVRAVASSGQRSGAALLSWANGTNGASAYFYCLEAPSDVYRNSTDSFARILHTFHIVQDPAVKKGSQVGNVSSAALSFVNWNDPHEGAFSVSVPQGWRIIGGTYRLSATDVRYAIAMGSPDGQLRATIGDSSIGVFIPPSQMLAMAGLREGGYYGLGDGTRAEIRRYIPGPQFARAYVQSFVARQCGGLQVQSNNVRPDLVSSFTQSARKEGLGGSPYITAGDVSFTCNLNGQQVRGKYVAATFPFVPNQTSMWAVYRLYGYLAAAGREQEGEQVDAQALRTWKFDPRWEARQQGVANSTVEQDNARSQQIRSRAMQAIADDQRQTSETITKGWEQRQKVYDEVSRRQENAILGTLDVVDPQTGTRYKVSNFGDYHYMSNEGYIYSTNSPDAPPPNLREMVTLPW